GDGRGAPGLRYRLRRARRLRAAAGRGLRGVHTRRPVRSRRRRVEVRRRGLVSAARRIRRRRSAAHRRVARGGVPMRRVMLWGEPGDGPFDAVRAELARRNTAHFALGQERALETSCTLAVGERAEGVLAQAGGAIALEEIDAVYARPYESWRVLGRAGLAPESDEVRHAAALEQALYAWLDIADALVVNRPSAMASNSSKPYQPHLIRAQGLRVPETLVRTAPDAAREFVARHGAVVYKSVSGVRSIVSRVSEESMARIDDVAWCPTQFQAQVPGIDHRVHVVGERIFVCQI